MTIRALAFICALAFAPAAFAQDSDLTGVWRGMYWGEGNAPTEFQATLRDESGPAVRGSIVETNSFSPEVTPFLLSTFEGSASGKAITFVKTYDGTGGQTHAVTYAGEVLAGGRRIVGSWSLGGTQGRFEMAR